VNSRYPVRECRCRIVAVDSHTLFLGFKYFQKLLSNYGGRRKDVRSGGQFQKRIKIPNGRAKNIIRNRFCLFLPDADKKDWFTFKSTIMSSNATAVEILAVIDYTTIDTRTGISVTRKVVLTTYFEHLQFVVPLCL
jgi:Ca2+-binding RTX toxin-like protein